MPREITCKYNYKKNEFFWCKNQKGILNTKFLPKDAFYYYPCAKDDCGDCKYFEAIEKEKICQWQTKSEKGYSCCNSDGINFKLNGNGIWADPCIDKMTCFNQPIKPKKQMDTPICEHQYIEDDKYKCKCQTSIMNQWSEKYLISCSCGNSSMKRMCREFKPIQKEEPQEFCKWESPYLCRGYHNCNAYGIYTTDIVGHKDDKRCTKSNWCFNYDFLKEEKKEEKNMSNSYTCFTSQNIRTWLYIGEVEYQHELIQQHKTNGRNWYEFRMVKDISNLKEGNVTFIMGNNSIQYQRSASIEYDHIRQIYTIEGKLQDKIKLPYHFIQNYYNDFLIERYNPHKKYFGSYLEPERWNYFVKNFLDKKKEKDEYIMAAYTTSSIKYEEPKVELNYDGMKVGDIMKDLSDKCGDWTTSISSNASDESMQKQVETIKEVTCSKCKNKTIKGRFCSECGNELMEVLPFNLEKPIIFDIPEIEKENAKKLRDFDLTEGAFWMACINCKYIKKRDQDLYPNEFYCSKYNNFILKNGNTLNGVRCRLWENSKFKLCDNCGYLVKKQRKCPICKSKLK